ncbi:uncharacterized protein A4U43_C06F5410 [Asparagus officinalis]|uniref:FAD-binding domain-containing protein n=1 Tax=Asparagus officinalis TaxID=4686 RepID=A0A5P1EKA3_ASPOF|nr:uncharacterized protein A4U43_C06F5410 [Asparagus officinalis]
MAEEQEVVIVGGGISGLATAVALQRLGVRSVVLERSDGLRTTGAALSLFTNAWRALDALGVAHKLTSIYPPMEGGSVTNLETGEELLTNLAGNRSGMGLRAVHRKMLLEALAEELKPDTIRFSSKLASIRTEVLKDSSTVVILHLEDGTIIRAKVLIGCDGVHSLVAQWLGLAAPINSGRSAVRGLAIYDEGHGLNYGANQFLSCGKRAGLIPLNDKEIYWFITNPTTPREKDMANEFTRDPSLILKEVTDNLAKEFPQSYLEVVEHSDLSSLTWAPLMLRNPWAILTGSNHKGTVTVVGDAMHPMTPDLGQGGCSALEDAVVLARNIGGALRSKENMSKVEEGMRKYVKERRWRVSGLVLGSYLSGWVQQGGSGLWGWAVRIFRDRVFYTFVYPRISAAVQYDCGVLLPPEV